MARSGTYSFTVTRDDLINAALVKVGALDPEGGVATATQITNGAFSLNMLVKSWHTQGMHLWTRRMVSITLTGASTYSLGGASVRPLRIVDGYVRTSTGNDTPIRVISKDEYNKFGVKNSTGTTVNVYYDPQLDTGVIYGYPLSSTGTLWVECEYPLMDFTLSSDTPDFPQEWYNALLWNLAKEIAMDYGVSAMRYGVIKNEATEQLSNVMSFDVESTQSTFFSPQRYGA